MPWKKYRDGDRVVTMFDLLLMERLAAVTLLKKIFHLAETWLRKINPFCLVSGFTAWYENINLLIVSVYRYSCYRAKYSGKN